MTSGAPPAPEHSIRTEYVLLWRGAASRRSEVAGLRESAAREWAVQAAQAPQRVAAGSSKVGAYEDVLVGRNRLRGKVRRRRWLTHE